MFVQKIHFEGTVIAVFGQHWERSPRYCTLFYEIHVCILASGVLITGWSKALPQIGRCLSSLSGFESQTGYVEELPVTIA